MKATLTASAFAVSRGRIRMSASRHRKAFVFGAFVGAAAGTVAAFWNAPQSGHRTRTQIQQTIERALFKALDMTPFQSGPTDTVTENRPATATEPVAGEPPVDILIGSRPSEVSAQQAS